MTYYSQAKEDKYLFKSLLSIAPPEHRNYIEIGALDGVKYSNTKFLEDSLGWSGILVEPNPISFKKLQINRAANSLLPRLVSNSSEELEFSYFENDNLAAVSGVTSTLTQKNKDVFFENDTEWLAKAKKSYLKKATIKPVTLDSIIADSQLGGFGFCSIDVEGHELQVLKSFSFNTEISILLIERNPNDSEIAQLLASHDYHFHESVAHNNVYLSQSYFKLFQTAGAQKVA